MGEAEAQRRPGTDAPWLKRFDGVDESSQYRPSKAEREPHRLALMGTPWHFRATAEERITRDFAAGRFDHLVGSLRVPVARARPPRPPGGLGSPSKAHPSDLNSPSPHVAKEETSFLPPSSGR